MFKAHSSNNSSTAFGFAIMAAAFVVASTLVTSSVQAAGSSTGTLQVRAQIDASCTIDSATLDFGKIDALNTKTNGSTTFDVTCADSTPYVVSMGAGNNGSDASERAMSNDSGDQLDYQLYTDSSRSKKWYSYGNCNQRPSSYDPTGTTSHCGYGSGGNTKSFTVYGKIPGGQSVQSGSEYTDTVAITVHY